MQGCWLSYVYPKSTREIIYFQGFNLANDPQNSISPYHLHHVCIISGSFLLVCSTAPHIQRVSNWIHFIYPYQHSLKAVSPLQLQLLSMISPLAHSPKCQTWRYSASPLYSQCITDSSLSFILILYFSPFHFCHLNLYPCYYTPELLQYFHICTPYLNSP